MATFLYFFYMKPSEEGRYTLYARRRIRLFEDAPTSDKGWKDRYFFVKREGLCDPVGTSESGIRSAWTERGLKPKVFCLYFPKTPSAAVLPAVRNFPEQEPKNLEEEAPSTQLSEEIPEGIPLPTLEVPYLHILEGCIRLLYGAPRPLWASYPRTDMGKLKMKISKAELEARRRRRTNRRRVSASWPDKGQERPTLNVVVEPSSLPIAIPSGDSPPPKRPRRSSPPAPAQDKGKEKQTTSMLGLEDSSTIRSDSSLLAQNVRYLSDAVIKVDKAFKKKAEAYINAAAANKTLEENNLALKQNVAEAIKRAGREMVREGGSPTGAKEGGQEDMEITSGEDEPDEEDALPVNQPDVPGLNAEPNDSFEEAMRLPSNEESGPGQTSRAANADDGAQD
ncbi:hypothetical protein FNV43_RR04946 [Rhamnella rubrinervis]|uniref:Uncharacterized protein n=1 Tax=Rhamnella rubrinervis TaxID=2594499 RepID=A0A8K0HMZ2_9ROSA|nr:hypothetical protein FNV43_RR04946 [Rhamnella rubrinervis]